MILPANPELLFTLSVLIGLAVGVVVGWLAFAPLKGE